VSHHQANLSFLSGSDGSRLFKEQTNPLRNFSLCKLVRMTFKDVRNTAGPRSLSSQRRYSPPSRTDSQRRQGTPSRRIAREGSDGPSRSLAAAPRSINQSTIKILRESNKKGNEETIRSLESKRLNSPDKLRGGRKSISSRFSSPEVSQESNYKIKAANRQGSLSMAQTKNGTKIEVGPQRMDSFGPIKVIKSSSSPSKPSSPRQKNAANRNVPNMKDRKVSIMISATDEVLEVPLVSLVPQLPSASNQRKSMLAIPGSQQDPFFKSRSRKPSTLNIRKKSGLVVAQPPPIPEPRETEKQQQETDPSRRRRKFGSNILSSIRIVSESSDMDANESPAKMNNFSIPEEDGDLLSSNQAPGRPKSARKPEDTSKVSQNPSQAKYVSSGTSTGRVLRNPLKPMKGQFIAPPQGTYMGHVPHPKIMGPPFPLPDKSMMLFGPFEEALDHVIQDLKIVHVYETLDAYYIPANKLSQPKKIMPTRTPKTPTRESREDILLPFQRPKTSVSVK
jgi:hypothetical protein